MDARASNSNASRRSTPRSVERQDVLRFLDGVVKCTYRLNFDQSPYTPFGGMYQMYEKTAKELAHVRCGALGNTDHRFATFQYPVRICKPMEGQKLCGQPRLDVIVRGMLFWWGGLRRNGRDEEGAGAVPQDGRRVVPGERGRE